MEARWRRWLAGVGLIAAPLVAHADPDPIGPAAQTVERAGRELRAGRPRTEVLAELRTGMRAARRTDDLFGVAVELAIDLEDSIQREDLRTAERLDPNRVPERFLADSRWIPVRWDPATERRMTWRSSFARVLRDPAKPLLAENRVVIERLLPLLDDRSPTRGFVRPPGNRWIGVPRVCDLALSLIEFHARVWFYDPFTGVPLLSMHPPAFQDQVGERARRWWEQARSLSIADGVRLQLPASAGFLRANLAESLIAIGEEEGDAALQAEGRGLLAGMLETTGGAADALTRHLVERLARDGDPRGVEPLHRGLVERQGYRYPLAPEAIDYLARYGGRREWELLTAWAREGYAARGPAPFRAVVGPALVRAAADHPTPWAVPALALALDAPGERSAPGPADPEPDPRLAGQAVTTLQVLTGQDFGHGAGADAATCLVAVARARRWWASDGQARYTFDAIAARLDAAAKASAPR